MCRALGSSWLLAALVLTMAPAAVEAATANPTFTLPADRDVAGTPACDPSDAQAIRLAVMGRGSLQQSCGAATRPAGGQNR